jgi:hypothetical protein
MEVIIAVLEIGDAFGTKSNIKEMRTLEEKGKCGQFKRDLSLIHVHLSKDFFRFWQEPELNGHAIMCCVCVFVCALRFSSHFAFGIVKFYELTLSFFCVLKRQETLRSTIHPININGEPFTLHE